MTNMLPASVGSDGRVNLFVGNVSFRVLGRRTDLITTAPVSSKMAGSEGSVQESGDGAESGCELGPG